MRKVDGVVDRLLVLFAILDLLLFAVFLASCSGRSNDEDVVEEVQTAVEHPIVVLPQQTVDVPVVEQEQAVVQVVEVVEQEIPFHYDCIPLTDEEQIALNEACERFDIDVALMCGLIYKESRFTNIVGDNGRSIGYCQIQPRWWSGLMEEIGAKDLHDPADNFLTAAAILRRHYDAYGTWERALTAYNTGAPGSSAYARAVTEYWQEWSEKLESEVSNG